MMDSAEIEALSEEEAKNELRYALGVITAHDLVTERMENRIRALEAENEQLWAICELIENDSVMVTATPLDPNGPVRFHIICNDTFDWATADAETISLSDAPMLLKLWKEGGDDALMRWVQDRRGGPESSPFIPPVQEYHNRIATLEAELAEAKNYLCGFLWFLDERALIRDISNDGRPDFHAGAARFTAWISRAVEASGRDAARAAEENDGD